MNRHKYFYNEINALLTPCNHNTRFRFSTEDNINITFFRENKSHNAFICQPVKFWCLFLMIIKNILQKLQMCTEKSYLFANFNLMRPYFFLFINWIISRSRARFFFQMSALWTPYVKNDRPVYSNPPKPLDDLHTPCERSPYQSNFAQLLYTW